jgi:hypothetical protein
MEQHSPVAQAQPIEPSSVPDWLEPGTPDQSLVNPVALVVDPAVAQHRRQLSRAHQEAMFDSMFERVLGEMVKGRTLKNVIDNDVREIEYEAFFRWIKRDPARVERYKEAKELRTEWWAGRLVEIAEADDSIEDVARSKLRIDTYKWLMGADNRRVYGDTKQVEINQSISITAALEKARARLPAADVIDVVDVETVSDEVMQAITNDQSAPASSDEGDES